MLGQMKVDIDDAWNEAEELHEGLAELTDEELIECRQALRNRARIIMMCLHEYAEWKED